MIHMFFFFFRLFIYFKRLEWRRKEKEKKRTQNDFHVSVCVWHEWRRTIYSGL